MVFKLRDYNDFFLCVKDGELITLRIFEEVEKMRKTLVVLLLALATCAVPITLLRAAEEPKPAEPAEKPLEPGWLSLDSSVGAADRWIALNKAVVENALGFSIGGYLDASYQWGSNYPGKPNSMSGRYFDQFYNQ